VTAVPVEAQRRKRKRLSAAEREQQILDIAEELFTVRGYDGVTIEDIARTAEVTRPIVYQYYGSKESVFLACVRRARQQFEEMILSRMGVDDATLTERIQAGGSAYFDLIDSDPRRWNLLFTTSATLEGGLADELTALREGTINAIAKVAKDFAPELKGEAYSAFAYVVSGIGEQLGRWWLSNPALSKSRVLAYYVAAVQGIADQMLAMPQALKRQRPKR
jgi:AcrR family transcriptional regulator